MPIAVPARRGLAAAFALPMLLAGCAVNTPPRLLASQSAGPLPAEVRIDSPDDPDARRFAAALQRNLAGRGKAVLPGADTALTITLAQRPATMGIAQEGPASDGVRWLSPPRRRHLFDGCPAQQVQVTVVARSDMAAQPLYAGRGAFAFCTLDPEKLDILAQAFARAMTSP